jgi:hypothetical protein
VSQPRALAAVVAAFVASQALAVISLRFTLAADWYVEQPCPGGLVVKQLGLKFLSSLVIGFMITSVLRPSASSAASSACPAAA